MSKIKELTNKMDDVTRKAAILHGALDNFKPHVTEKDGGDTFFLLVKYSEEMANELLALEMELGQFERLFGNVVKGVAAL